MKLGLNGIAERLRQQGLRETSNYMKWNEEVMVGMECKPSIRGRLNAIYCNSGWGQKPLSARGQGAILTTGWAIEMSETSSPTKTTMRAEGTSGLSQFSLCATESERKSGAIYCPEVPLSHIFFSRNWRLKIEMSH